MNPIKFYFKQIFVKSTVTIDFSGLLLCNGDFILNSMLSINHFLATLRQKKV